MSERAPTSIRPEKNPTGSFPLPRRNEGESSAVSQDRHASALKPTREPKKGEERGNATRFEEVTRLRREVEDLSVRIERQDAEMAKLRREEDILKGKCKRREDRITRKGQEIERMRRAYQEEGQRRFQHVRAVEEELKQTKELLATRSAELSETQTFLSTTDRVSEVEVLGIVRSLNENIYQVAVHLTEEWEKLEPPPGTSRMYVDPTSRPRVSTLVQLVRNRDPMGLTFLLQSSLCSEAVDMTSSWGNHQESDTFNSVYQRLSASEGQAISARWRSLTHSYLSQPPLHRAPLAERLANALDQTGSFSSTQHSLKFVETVSLEGIESAIRLALRLKSVFMSEVTSSDMTLLFEAPGAVFDEARMANEYGSDSRSTPRKRNRIVGTTEVGVGKSISEGAGKGRRTEILLKTKVVLEKDVIGS